MGGRVAGAVAVAVTWPAVYLLARSLLMRLQGVAEVGEPLAGTLLSLVLLFCLGILLLSNTISSLSSFYLSRDLRGLRAAPLDPLALYGARLTETAVHSSWMVVLLLVPVLAAYERVFGGGVAFHLLATAAVVPLLVIPAVAGTAVTTLLVRVFPARRTRDLLAAITLVAAALLVAGLRLMQPERLVRPGEFQSLVEFLASLQGPASPWLPSEWAARAMRDGFAGSLDLRHLALLWSTAGAAVVLGATLHARLYGRCYTRAREASDRGVRYGGLWRLLGRMARRLGPRRGELVLKDARTFSRDATQWSQLAILAVLVLVYVYNMRALPLDVVGGPGRILHLYVVVLNLALSGFVLAAVAARFVFPAASLEGPARWLLGSSPLPTREVAWAKYWIGTLPLLVLGAALTAGTGWFLDLGTGYVLLTLASVVLLTGALSAQALAWGAAHPRFDVANAAEIPTSVGGLLFMGGAMLNLAAVVAAQLWALGAPVPGGLPRGPGGEEGLWTAGLLTGAICVPAAVAAYRWAVREMTGALGTIPADRSNVAR